MKKLEISSENILLLEKETSTKRTIKILKNLEDICPFYKKLIKKLKIIFSKKKATRPINPSKNFTPLTFFPESNLNKNKKNNIKKNMKSTRIFNQLFLFLICK